MCAFSTQLHAPEASHLFCVVWDSHFTVTTLYRNTGTLGCQPPPNLPNSQPHPLREYFDGDEVKCICNGDTTRQMSLIERGQY